MTTECESCKGGARDRDRAMDKTKATVEAKVELDL